MENIYPAIKFQLGQHTCMLTNYVYIITAPYMLLTDLDRWYATKYKDMKAPLLFTFALFLVV
jgi:hypothetical protein